MVICNVSDAQSRCAQGCQKNARVRRDVEDHSMYALAQGPITLDYAVDYQEGHEYPDAKKTETAGERV